MSISSVQPFVKFSALRIVIYGGVVVLTLGCGFSLASAANETAKTEGVIARKQTYVRRLAAINLEHAQQEQLRTQSAQAPSYTLPILIATEYTQPSPSPETPSPDLKSLATPPVSLSSKNATPRPGAPAKYTSATKPSPTKPASSASPSPTIPPSSEISTPTPVFPSTTPTPSATFSNSGLSVGGIINLSNQARANNGLPVLRSNSLLDQAAQARADDMIARHYFSHTSPTNTTYVEPVAAAGYNWRSLGENIAYGSIGYFNDQKLLEGWMNSPGHRANILSSNFQEIGVGIGQGDYNGSKVWYAVQIFGTPL